MENYKNVPCGVSLPPDNPHAVSVSLPLISDVIGYEEQDPEVTEKMKSGYPRFFQNLLVQKVRDHIRASLDTGGDLEIIPVSTINSIPKIEKQLGRTLNGGNKEDVSFLKVPKDSAELNEIRSFLQHSGMILSSRRAEDFLIRNGLMNEEFSEDLESAEESEKIIKQILAEGYGSTEREDVFLCTTGCNAFYSAFTAVKEISTGSGKDTFVQLGWLYLDTMEIMRKYSGSHAELINILDTDAFEAYIKENHARVACAVTEVPNNPLVQTPDLPRIKKILSKYKIPLLADSTISTPFNMEIMEYADIAVESLTKYACGNGDVMMGAVVLNKNSSFAQKIKSNLMNAAEQPYIKDIRRLASEIRHYQKRVSVISENTYRLVDYFKSSQRIKKIHWALSSPASENYRKIMKTENSVPGLVSVVFDKDLRYYYDRLPVSKGPSFGTEFTLAMPYIYMAHYDMLKSEEGKTGLRKLGLDPELLRISVGAGDADEIIAAFEESGI